MEMQMKKMTVLLAVLATLAGTAGHAQTTGRGAQASRNTTSNNWAWGIGLGGLAVIGVVVGLAVAGGTSSQSASNSFTH